MTARLRCGHCGHEATDDQPFYFSVAYLASADGQATGLDHGDLVVTWDQAGIIDHYTADRFITCPECDHTWKTRRSWVTAAQTRIRAPATPNRIRP